MARKNNRKKLLQVINTNYIRYLLVSDVEYGFSIFAGGGIVRPVSSLFTECACVHFCCEQS